jgi:molybdopterin-guanine dinucleotide biosynthesis protein A
MKIAMPAAVLAGGASRRMGRPKAALPYGAGTLLEHQTSRLAEVFSDVYAVLKEKPEFAVGPAQILIDRSPDHAAIHGLARSLEEVEDRVFVLAVDLPLLPADAMRVVAARSFGTAAPAVLPRAEGRLQPLAAVWRRCVLPAALERIARGKLSLRGLAQEVGADVIGEEEWRRGDPSGNGFTNWNTMEQYLAAKERA